jgi:hypothetical protein
MPPRAFTRSTDLPGWSAHSAWGYDEAFECYWAELRRDDDSAEAPRVRISRDHLIPTPAVLARVIANQIGIDQDAVWPALVCPTGSPAPAARAAPRAVNEGSWRATVANPEADGHPGEDGNMRLPRGPRAGRSSRRARGQSGVPVPPVQAAPGSGVCGPFT